MLSITVPVYNEEESIGPLVVAVRDAMHGWSEDWELILVDDGSRDDTARAVAGHAQTDSRVRLVRLARNYGQSAAMQAGFDHARGDVIVTMDGDLQNDPRDIPALMRKLEEGFDLVAGYRQRRKDLLLSRRVPSWLGNVFVRAATGVRIRDTGCTLKVFRRELLDRLRLYSDLHRFIPALAVMIAGAHIAELPVRHHARSRGRSKYGWSRITQVLVDLLTLVMLNRFREHPLRMFSLAGLGPIVIALIASAMAAAEVLDIGRFGSPVILIALAACWLALGSFLVMTGLIAESFLHAESDEPVFDDVILRAVS
ncbi:MAG TPA: glycosyltransferase family 2 protein [Gemmatimonadaceae bacterium]|nr:glycosyltransferase family 2 protein [Gemmatimonadaceae bacterium]